MIKGVACTCPTALSKALKGGKQRQETIGGKAKAQKLGQKESPDLGRRETAFRHANEID